MANKKIKKEELSENNELKQKENKNQPLYNFECTAKRNGEDVEKKYEIIIKKATRSLFYEADMYFSIQLNKYIKMGLLTNEQVAKTQIENGGSLSEEQQKKYSKLQAINAEKEEMYMRLMSKKDLSEEEEKRKRSLLEDMSLLKNTLAEYEYAKNQIYDHTANSKARNDTILWWTLHLTQFSEINEDGSKADPEFMFSGEDFQIKKMSLEELEDNEDELLEKCFSKIVRIITLWYWVGISDRSKISSFLKEDELYE